MPRGRVTDELDRLPRRGRARWRRHDDRRVLRGLTRADASTANTLVLDRDRSATCAGSPTPCTPRAALVARAARPRRSGREHAVQPHARRSRRRPGFSPPAMGLVKGATADAARRRSSRDFEDAARDRGRGRVRRDRDPPRAQLPAQLVLEPQPQPAHRRLRRQHRERRAAFPRRVVERVRARGRRLGRRHGEVQHGRRCARRGCGSTRACRSRGCSKPTATSTRCSSPAAARCSTAMYFFRGDVPMAEFVATQPQLVGWGLQVYRAADLPDATRSRRRSSCRSPASSARRCRCR